MTSSLTIILPAYNEGHTIRRVIDEIKKQQYDFVEEIIVVDDGSTDDTALNVQGSDVKLLRHKVNKGYGASIKEGVRLAKSDYVLTYDADGQHQVQDIKKLWDARIDNDLIIGARSKIFHSRLWRMPGKWIIKLLATYILNQKIPDLNSGLRLFYRPTLLKYLHVCSDRFSFSTTSTMTFLYRGYNVEYIPINVQKSQNNSAVTVMTGFNTIVLILRMATLFSPLRLFLPLSGLFFLSGMIWGLPIILSHKGVSVGALFAMLSGVIIFVLGLMSDQISQMRIEKFE